MVGIQAALNTNLIPLSESIYCALLNSVISGSETKKPMRATILAIHLMLSSCSFPLGHKIMSATPRSGKKHTMVKMLSMKKLIG